MAEGRAKKSLPTVVGALEGPAKGVVTRVDGVFLASTAVGLNPRGVNWVFGRFGFSVATTVLETGLLGRGGVGAITAIKGGDDGTGDGRA